MQFSQDIKPISWLKDNASQMARTINETGNSMIITQNGEAKLVVMDVKQYDKLQQSLALLRLLSASEAEIEAGKTINADVVFAECQAIIDAKRRES